MDSKIVNATSIFFAYASQPPLHADTMRETIHACRQRGLNPCGWQELAIGGKVLIDTITERIDSSEACVAEISSNNSNVLFEAGYALAKGKRLYLTIDESDQEAVKSWNSLRIVETVGKIDYGGNAQVLASILAKHMSEESFPLLESLLSQGRPRKDNAIFAPGVPHKTTPAERLEKLLERKTDLYLLAAQEEFGLASLSYYVQSIYRSSAAILHFMKPTRVLASQYNARLAFVGGIAHGFGLPLLMVAEDNYQAPIDYRDLTYTYTSAASLTEYVDEWLAKLPSSPGSNKRLGKLKLDIELPIRTFGEYVAEAEKKELTDYFVHTNEFEAVLSGRATVFTGRKGTGKTATMQEAASELQKDRRVLVVPIKPSSYDLAGLTSILERFSAAGNREYFLLNLWNFLLTTEVAIRVLDHAEDMPAGLGSDTLTTDLHEVLQSLGIDRDADLSTRLDDVVTNISDQLIISAESEREISDDLKRRWRDRILRNLKPVLHNFDRVAVLIDNLDKTWEKGANFEVLSQFILSVLVTSGKLKDEFLRSSKDVPSANLTLTIFLRTDIYDVISTYAREPDKINPQIIQWADEELLIRVLEDRYAANRGSKSKDVIDGMWERLFCAEVNGLATRDYILRRALGRPRDVIYLGNSALTTAINRRHDRIFSQDVKHAEGHYSQFAIEALLVESEAQDFDLAEIIFDFAGLDSTLDEAELESIIPARDERIAVVRWLVQASFLGLESRDGGFVYVEGESEAKKKLKAASRLSERMGRPMRYRVHPAFRPFLDIRDDDLQIKQDSVDEELKS